MGTATIQDPAPSLGATTGSATRAGTRLLLDDDVAGGINTIRHSLSPCVQAHGSLMLVDAPEQKQPLAAGHELDRVLTTNDRVASNNTYFATGSPNATRPCCTPRRKRHPSSYDHPLPRSVKSQQLTWLKSGSPRQTDPAPKMEQQHTPEPYSRPKGCPVVRNQKREPKGRRVTVQPFHTGDVWTAGMRGGGD